MSNGEGCCILGICCPPEQQYDKVKQAMHDLGADADLSVKIAVWFNEHVTAKAVAKAVAHKLEQ